MAGLKTFLSTSVMLTVASLLFTLCSCTTTTTVSSEKPPQISMVPSDKLTTASLEAFANQLSVLAEPHGFLPRIATRLLNPKRIVVVRQDGKGDFLSIQRAVESIKNSSAKKPDTILIYPGVYYGVISISTNYLSLVGVDKKTTRIEAAHQTSGSTPHRNDAVVNVTGENVNLINLSIRNTLLEDGSGVTPAVHYKNRATGMVYNCYLGGNGGRDIFDVLWGARVISYFVTVEQYRKISLASHPLWVASSGAALSFLFGQVINSGVGHGMQLATTGDCLFRYSYFALNSYLVDATQVGRLEFVGCKVKRSKLIMNAQYRELVEDFKSFGKVTITGELLSKPPMSELIGTKLTKRSRLSFLEQVLSFPVRRAAPDAPETGEIYVDASVTPPALKMHNGAEWLTFARVTTDRFE